MVIAELFLDEVDVFFLTEFSKVGYRPFIHTCSTTSRILLYRPVCQLNVFFALDDFHQMIEHLAFLAVRIQTVKGSFQSVILRVADFPLFWFPFLLLRSQHRHHPLSVQIFFVILEAVFVVFSLFLLNPTCGYPSTAYLFTVSQVLCHYSHWNKEWLLPSREGIPIHRVIGLQQPLRPQLSTFRHSYHWISLGPSSKPASSYA
jgi:hypothetical protein